MYASNLLCNLGATFVEKQPQLTNELEFVVCGCLFKRLFDVLTWWLEGKSGHSSSESFVFRVDQGLEKKGLKLLEEKTKNTELNNEVDDET